MKKKSIFDKKLKEITFNTNGLFCPLSFTLIFEDKLSNLYSQWLVPPNLTKIGIEGCVKRVLQEYKINAWYRKKIWNEVKKLKLKSQYDPL
jgi:hypothetical protein